MDHIEPCCIEVDKERRVWDERANTIADDIEVRGPLKKHVNQLNRSRAYIYELFKKSEKSNLLLDVGCGNGLFTTPLTNIFSFIVGVDVSKAMIKRCKEKKDNLDFIVASATDLPLKDHVFDAALSLSVLECLRPKDNVEKVLKEISRTTTNDSFIFITFWDQPNSPADFVRDVLKGERYSVKQSLVSRLQFTKLQLTRYVKVYAAKHSRANVLLTLRFTMFLNWLKNLARNI